MPNSSWIFRRKVDLTHLKDSLFSNIGYYFRNMSIIQRIKYIVKERGGVKGLYRGIAPGTLRSFIANGSAMVVMQVIRLNFKLENLV